MIRLRIAIADQYRERRRRLSIRRSFIRNEVALWDSMKFTREFQQTKLNG
jgi:hypothetical protein